MSFPSLNNTSDYDVYTTKYLQSIALQIQLNQNNFDKNVGYMKTGVQDTERPDSRSIEERAGDVEKLKVQARVMLNKISDATNTNEVLDYLVKNGELLFFFIQQFPAIEKLVKEQYAGGVRAPILISLIYKRFISQQEDSLMPESADFDIVSKVMSSEDAMILANQTQTAQLKEGLTTLAKNLPSQQEKQKLLNDPAGNKDEIKFVAELFKNSPNIDDYNRLIEEYNDAPLKDEKTNYDLERAEEVMLETITAFLEEKIQFQESESNTRRVEEIQKTNKKRITRQLPVAKDTRLVPTSEQERTTKRARRKAVEYIKESQFNLKPSITNVSEVPAAEQFKQEREAKRRTKLLENISTTRPLKPTTTKKSKTVAERVREEEEQAEIEAKLKLVSFRKKQQESKQNKDDEAEAERLMNEAEAERLMNEMEQLKKDKQKRQDEREKLEDKLQQVKLIREKYARRKISAFVNKQLEKNEEKMFELDDKLTELNKLDDTDVSKEKSIKAIQAEQEILKKKGTRKGIKNRPKEVIEKEKAEKEERRLKALEKKQAGLDNRLLGVQLPTPVGSTTPQKKKSENVPVQTGKGLLNKQEQLSHRFKVLKGEILAGNTASQVIKEMRSLVKQLVSSQELSIDQANGILKELKTL